MTRTRSTRLPDSDTPVITIDGPAASGKGTLAQRLSADLGFHLLDSGLLYRIVGFLAADARIAKDQESEVERLLADRVVFRMNDEAGSEFVERDYEVRITKGIGVVDEVSVNGRDVLLELRNEKNSFNASLVATMSSVRERLVPIQRRMCLPPGLVADGRDMGTVVFPNAHVKFFLEASVEARAERRLRQTNWALRDGMASLRTSIRLDDLAHEIEQRDERDRTRDVARLRAAPDAIRIDTTAISIDEMVKLAQDKVKNVMALTTNRNKRVTSKGLAR